jgi:hypothetical protein
MFSDAERGKFELDDETVCPSTPTSMDSLFSEEL